MENFVRNVGIAFLKDALFPRFCLRCRREGTAWCQSCEEAWVMRAPSAGCPFCRSGDQDRTCEACRPETYLDGVFALSSYADPVVREAITMWKYHGDSAYQAVIEKWIRRALGRGEAAHWNGAVSFVPLHIGKRRARGFDQAERVAETVAREVGVPMTPLLRRVRRTSAQAQVGHAERRLGEMDGVFETLAPVPERVLLCDDVFTSGSTMDAAARVLKAAGAKEVLGFVIARGGDRTGT